MKKKCIPFLFAAMMGAALYSQQGLTANFASQYMLGVPTYNRHMMKGKTNESSVTIISDKAKGNYPENATFIGNVDITQGNSRLQADKVQLHQKCPEGTSNPVRTVEALGNVRYGDNQVTLKGFKAWSNLNTKDTNVWKGDYQIVGRQGRGKADLIKKRSQNRYTILENGSFTTCLPGCDTWNVVGSEVIHDHKEQLVKIWNAYLKLGPIPIFYSPYLQFPEGDKRRSGFLTPNAKYSIANYFEFYWPYYWNISPNIDATITPHYVYKRSNIIWENEFRYLTQLGMGLMEFYYLPLDKVFKNEHPRENNRHRWLCYWQHSGVIDQVWRFNANYTKVSDPYYFNDFSSRYGSSADSYTTKMFSLNYAAQNFDAMLSTRQFQIFNNQRIRSCGTEPQLDINWYQNNGGPFNIRVYGQAVHFVNANSDMPKITRLHLEPAIYLTWSNDWANLDTELKLMASHYQQKNLKNYNIANNVDLEESVNRTIPQFKLAGKLVFERHLNLECGYTQTLEPKMQYLYVPYRNQSKINNYDSSLLQSDYIGLFRNRTYSGLDRIPSVNQVTASVTNRIFDDKAVERFNFSVGQIYFFSKSRTADDNIHWKNDNRTGPLVWIGDIYWRVTNRWGARGSVQYDSRLDAVTTSSASLEHFRDEKHMVQLAHRYVSPEYIQVMLPGCSTRKQYNQGISQVGGIATWPLSDSLSIVGAYYFDINARKAAEKRIGLQYNSCCYAIRVGYERKLNGWNVNSNQSKYENIIGFNLELRGLNPSYSLNTQQMFHSNILPYRSFL